MELTPIRYFNVIAHERHLTRAAERLGVTQPALSAALKKLEGELGAQLLHRTSRGVELTEAGEVFLRHAERAINAADEAISGVRRVIGLEQGSLSVGGGATATGYLLPRAVRRFHEEHPGVRFHVREAASSAVQQGVLAGELDLGIVTLPLNNAGDGDIIVIHELADELRLIAPGDHKLAKRRTFRWRDLDGEPMIAFEAGSAVRRVIDDQALAYGVTLRPVMELRSIETIRRHVQAGIGCALVSRFALPKGEGARCKDGMVVRQLAVIRRSDRVPSPAAQRFERLLLRSM
jgi:DNA-binding transcriptional LysR family regulator